MKPEQLEILQQSLGLDKHGKGRSYRNRFVTGKESGDFPVCRSLVDMGHMVDTGEQRICGGMHLFYVTISGQKAVRRESQPPPKLTCPQRRYREYLDADSSLTFIEWMKCRTTM